VNRVINCPSVRSHCGLRVKYGVLGCGGGGGAVFRVKKSGLGPGILVWYWIYGGCGGCGVKEVVFDGVCWGSGLGCGGIRGCLVDGVLLLVGGVLVLVQWYTFLGIPSFPSMIS